MILVNTTFLVESGLEGEVDRLGAYGIYTDSGLGRIPTSVAHACVLAGG